MNDIIILSSLHIFIIMNITFNHSTIIISIETAIISKARLQRLNAQLCRLLVVVGDYPPRGKSL